jgi:hypothetical protein
MQCRRPGKGRPPSDQRPALAECLATSEREASDGLGIRVETLADLSAALEQGLAAVDAGRAAVLNVMVSYSDNTTLADSNR